MNNEKELNFIHNPDCQHTKWVEWLKFSILVLINYCAGGLWIAKEIGIKIISGRSSNLEFQK